MSSPQPRVSVVMRTMNSEWSVREALAGLFAQEFKDFDLLVIDNESSDGTLDIVRQYPCRLVHLPAQAYFPGDVLNQGVRQTAGEFVVFHNSDAIPLTPKTYTNLLAPFDDPLVQATFARQVCRPDAAAWVRHDYAASFPECGSAPPWMKYSVPLAAMRRSIWQVRGFYQDAFYSEDTEWGNWARTHGYVVHYAADALVMHSHNYTLSQLYGRRFVEGEADVFIYGGHDSLGRMAARVLKAVFNDARWLCRHGKISELLPIPVQRCVYHWAYYRGHKAGERRKTTGDTDRTRAQQVIKTRHNRLG